MTEVPAYVPMLIKGVSENPQHGGCVVQIANWLYDPQLWTDEPVCVNYVLANAAIIINDLVDDDHRRQMALLAPRLSGTLANGGVAVGRKLDEWTKSHPEPYKMAPPVREVKRTENGEEWVIYPVPHYLLTVSEQDAIDWLTALLDEYDRITGRTTEPLPVEKWDEIRELLGQK